MKKYIVYGSTYAIHGAIVITWLYYTNLIGFALLLLHWIPFKGCFLNPIERWIHFRLVGQSYIRDDFSSSFIYKQFKRYSMRKEALAWYSHVSYLEFHNSLELWRGSTADHRKEWPIEMIKSSSSTIEAIYTEVVKDNFSIH